MGQKVSPVGLRVGINRDWDAAWYAGKNQVADLLQSRFKCSNCNSCYKSFPDANNQLKTIINLIIKKMDIDDDDFKDELLYNIAIRYNKHN